MKNIKLSLTGMITALAVAFIFLASSVLAAVPPSIERGDIYYGKNLTKNTELGDPISADKCDELLYKIRVHNPGPTETATNVTVQVAFPTAASNQNVSLATIKADNIYPTSASDSATVNISSVQKVTYVAGSTQLLDANSNLISNLPDAITGAGVNIGNVGVSINNKRFVQFKAKIDCPKPPCVDNPNTPGDECNPCKDNPNTPEDECNPCVDNPKTPANECKPETPEQPQTPGKLPETGAGAVIGSFIGISTVSGVAYHFIRRRLGL